MKKPHFNTGTYSQIFMFLSLFILSEGKELPILFWWEFLPLTFVTSSCIYEGSISLRRVILELPN